MESAPLDLLRETLTTALIVMAPVLLVALAVGLVMAVVQAATQVQDQAVNSVPKLLACGIALVALAAWMASHLVAFAVRMFGGAA